MRSSLNQLTAARSRHISCNPPAYRSDTVRNGAATFRDRDSYACRELPPDKRRVARAVTVSEPRGHQPGCDTPGPTHTAGTIRTVMAPRAGVPEGSSWLKHSIGAEV